MTTHRFCLGKEIMVGLLFSGACLIMIMKSLCRESTAIVLLESNAVFPNLLSFFVLAVYFPSSNHDDQDFSEYLDLLWSLYDSLSTESLVVVMGDLNAAMGNATGNKSTREPTRRGKKIVRICALFQFVPCQFGSMVL